MVVALIPNISPHQEHTPKARLSNQLRIFSTGLIMETMHEPYSFLEIVREFQHLFY